MIRSTVLALCWLLLCLAPATSQSDEVMYPFECLPEFGLSHIEARSFYVAKTATTPAYWDVPEDTELHGGYNNEWINTYRFWYSASADEYYVLVHDTEPVQEQDPETGEDFLFLSWHPCGHGAITPEQYEMITGGTNED